MHSDGDNLREDPERAIAVEHQGDFWNRLASYPIDASVIDPNDTSGRKNAYLAEIRNAAILDALGPPPAHGVVLDLGCGTGSLSAAIAGSDWLVGGIDISMGLLRRTPERKLGEQALFVQYNGDVFPLADESVDAVCTYVVLNHILDASQLSRVLAECRRVLKPEGRLVCIEQVRAHAFLDEQGWKYQPTPEFFPRAFTSAGFIVESADVLRYGRFPTTPLVRWGLAPKFLWPLLARLESWVGSVQGVPRTSYCDIRFVASLPLE